MSENLKPPYRRQILDDLFDAYTILSNGAYVSLYDAVGQMTRYCSAAVELFGLKGEYIPAGADNWSDFVHPEDRGRYQTIMSKLIAGTARSYDLHYRVRLRDGSYSMLRFVGSILRDQSGKPEIIGGLMMNEGLMESTDNVTALRNRYGFFQDLVAIMDLQRRCHVLMIGISKMENINEMQGYSYGNRVLQQMGWFLQENLGQYGTVYRVDGVKFVLLSESTSVGELSKHYENIRQTLLSGIQVDDVRQNLLISGGLISVGGKSMNEQAIYSALKYVCRESRIHKNGRLVNFDGIADRDSQDSLRMIDEIRNNVLLECAGFYLNYQGIFDARTGAIIAVDSIIRYRSAVYGDVASSEFLPVLERDYVFEELGYWVLRETMVAGRRLLDVNSDLMICVGISQVQLEDEFFIDELQKIARKCDFPLENLCLELSRTSRLLEMDFLKEIVFTLKSKGVKIAIDDFGSGLASIDFLRELLSDYIKFDKKYTAGFGKVENRQIIRCLSDLASACGTKVCVTGIENRAINDAIKAYAVDRVQGNYYAPPMSFAELVAEFFAE